MEGLKATAIAHASQALIGFHGFTDEEKRVLPVDLIYCTLEGLTTTSTIELLRVAAPPEVVIDGEQPTPHEVGRISGFVRSLTDEFDLPGSFILHSKSTFPRACGLASSSSGFAALACCVAALAGVQDPEEMSSLAWLGSVSAANSILGGISRLFAGETKPRAKRVFEHKAMPFSVFCVPVTEARSTFSLHRESKLSPLYGCFSETRQDYADRVVEAIGTRDFWRVGELVEQSMLLNIAAVSTGPSHEPVWRPSTLRFYLELRRKRAQSGIPAFMAISSGPSVFCYVSERAESVVRAIMKDQGLSWIKARPGPGVKLAKCHLF